MSRLISDLLLSSQHRVLRTAQDTVWGSRTLLFAPVPSSTTSRAAAASVPTYGSLTNIDNATGAVAFPA